MPRISTQKSRAVRSINVRLTWHCLYYHTKKYNLARLASALSSFTVNKEVLCKEEMMTPLIVGGNHHEDFGKNVLFDDYARKRFAEEICPLITEKTVIILEGAYHRPVFHPAHKKYEWHRRQAERWLDIKFPAACTIIWRDRRTFPVHRALVDNLFRGVRREIIDKIPQPGLTCSSLVELVQRIEDGLPAHLPKRKLHQAEKLVLWGHFSWMREFDRPAIATAKKYQDTHQVIIVCGATHTLAIRRSEWWGLKLLVPETRHEAHSLIRAYHAAYVLPTQFPSW